MKILKTVFVIFLGFFSMISCQRDEIGIQKKEENLSIKISQKKEMLEETSLIVASLTDSHDIHEEVFKKIQQSVAFGLDEEVRFKEILDDNASKINLKSSKVSNLLGLKLKDYFSMNQKSASLNDIEKFIMEGNVQIYWPYSENWDGKSEPAFSFNPIIDVDENIGFKRIISDDGTLSFDTVLVNDDYCFNNPVWIININNTDYESLPNFTNGEFEKNGTIFTQKGNALKSIKMLPNFNDRSKSYEIQIGAMKCKSQYDNIFNGGSDFVTRMVGVKEQNATSLPEYYIKHREDFTRGEIRDEVWKDYYMSINDDWGVDESDNAYFFYEEDDTDADLSFSGSLVYKGITVNFDVKYDESDNVLYDKQAWDRDLFWGQTLGTGDANAEYHGQWRIFKAGDVEWTIPYVIR